MLLKWKSGQISQQPSGSLWFHFVIQFLDALINTNICCLFNANNQHEVRSCVFHHIALMTWWAVDCLSLAWARTSGPHWRGLWVDQNPSLSQHSFLLSPQKLRHTVEVAIILLPHQLSGERDWHRGGEQQLLQQTERGEDWQFCTNASRHQRTLSEENKVHYTNKVPQLNPLLTWFILSGQHQDGCSTCFEKKW